MTIEAKRGRCLCGVLAFTATDVELGVHSCHCGMCRRWSGGPAMAASVAGIEFDDDAALCVYSSSEWGERGFCSRCGTSLFFRLKEKPVLAVWAGTFDDPDGLELAGEIFIDEKPGFYEFVGNHPRKTGQEFLEAVGMASDAAGE